MKLSGFMMIREKMSTKKQTDGEERNRKNAAMS